MQEHSHGHDDLADSASRYRRLGWRAGVFTVVWANLWIFFGVHHDGFTFLQFLVAEIGCVLLGYVRGKYGR